MSASSCSAPQHAGELDYEALLDRGRAGDMPPRPGEDEPAWLLYTSGTTGRAKGALLTHRNIMAAVLNMLCGSDLGRDEVSLFMFPMFHIAGYVLPGYLLRGYTIVLDAGLRRRNLPRQCRKIRHHPARDRADHAGDGARRSSHRPASTRRAFATSPMALRRWRRRSLRAAMARWPNVGFRTAFGMTELRRQRHLSDARGS